MSITATDPAAYLVLCPRNFLIVLCPRNFLKYCVPGILAAYLVLCPRNSHTRATVTPRGDIEHMKNIVVNVKAIGDDRSYHARSLSKTK
jgi:hypothetical protein